MAADATPAAEWACQTLPRVLFASDAGIAGDVYDALRTAPGSAPEARLEVMWTRLDGFGLREAGERFLARRWAREQQARQDARHDERRPQ